MTVSFTLWNIKSPGGKRFRAIRANYSGTKIQIIGHKAELENSDQIDIIRILFLFTIYETNIFSVDQYHYFIPHTFTLM